MEQLPTINLRKGATTVVQVDLSNFDMQGGYVALASEERIAAIEARIAALEPALT